LIEHSPEEDGEAAIKILEDVILSTPSLPDNLKAKFINADFARTLKRMFNDDGVSDHVIIEQLGGRMKAAFASEQREADQSLAAIFKMAPGRLTQ